MKYNYYFKRGRSARAGRAKTRSTKHWRGVRARPAAICYNSSPYPRRLESFRLAVWRQGHLPLVGLGLLSEAQFISRDPVSFPGRPSFHSVLLEDYAVGVSLEPLAEHVRVERHLVRGDLHDTEAVDVQRLRKRAAQTHSPSRAAALASLLRPPGEPPGPVMLLYTARSRGPDDSSLLRGQSFK